MCYKRIVIRVLFKKTNAISNHFQTILWQLLTVINSSSSTTNKTQICTFIRRLSDDGRTNYFFDDHRNDNSIMTHSTGEGRVQYCLCPRCMHHWSIRALLVARCSGAHPPGMQRFNVYASQLHITVQLRNKCIFVHCVVKRFPIIPREPRRTHKEL